jgi:hypothetical protein
VWIDIGLWLTLGMSLSEVCGGSRDAGRRFCDTGEEVGLKASLEYNGWELEQVLHLVVDPE